VAGGTGTEAGTSAKGGAGGAGPEEGGGGAVDGVGAWGPEGGSPGLGSRGGSLLVGIPARLPGMAGVRTFKFRRFPSSEAPSPAGAALSVCPRGQGISAEHWGQGARPSGWIATSTTAWHAGQGDRKTMGGVEVNIRTALKIISIILIILAIKIMEI
jgi:hypothetical protein